MPPRRATSKPIGPVASLLFPLPFLLGTSMVIASFRHNEADFVFGNVTSIDAVLVDRGPPHRTGGRPRYFPTFRLLDGRRLTLERAAVADELPPTGQPVQLRCSTRQPTNCRMPLSAGIDPGFYAIGAAWSLLAAGITLATWGPLVRTLLRRSRAGRAREASS